MENSALFKPQERFIESWHECYLSDSKITGFVCTMSLHNKKHNFYGLNDLEVLLKQSYSHKTDLYLSLNAFDYGSRKAEDLKQIRNIGIDVDCYKLNISVEDAVKEIQNLIYKCKIPNPNLLIYSGRGIQLVYSISGGASPKLAYLSEYITIQFIAQLQHIGADYLTDVTRVFRLPYSVNGRNDKLVDVQIWRTLEYDLMELYSYCTPLERQRKPHKAKKGTLVTLPPQRGLKSLYSQNTARKNDLEKLVVLRNGDIEKRNVMTYIYAYTVALLLKEKNPTIAFSQQLNEKFNDPQKKKEVQRTAGRAYDDAKKFWEEYEKRDYKMWYKWNDGIKRPMKNTTVIKELDITPSEMTQFASIIDKETKYSRKVKKRREQGVKPREEYLSEAEARRKEARELKEKGFKYKQIAEKLNVSVDTVKSWFRKKV